MQSTLGELSRTKHVRAWANNANVINLLSDGLGKYQICQDGTSDRSACAATAAGHQFSTMAIADRGRTDRQDIYIPLHLSKRGVRIDV